jgi:hypothetical protein
VANLSAQEIVQIVDLARTPKDGPSKPVSNKAMEHWLVVMNTASKGSSFVSPHVVERSSKKELESFTDALKKDHGWVMIGEMTCVQVPYSDGEKSDAIPF